jgi:hypothetical protein
VSEGFSRGARLSAKTRSRRGLDRGAAQAEGREARGDAAGAGRRHTTAPTKKRRVVVCRHQRKNPVDDLSQLTWEVSLPGGKMQRTSCWGWGGGDPLGRAQGGGVLSVLTPLLHHAIIPRLLLPLPLLLARRHARLSSLSRPSSRLRNSSPGGNKTAKSVCATSGNYPPPLLIFRGVHLQIIDSRSRTVGALGTWGGERIVGVPSAGESLGTLRFARASWGTEYHRGSRNGGSGCVFFRPKGPSLSWIVFKKLHGYLFTRLTSLTLTSRFTREGKSPSRPEPCRGIVRF